MLDESFKTLHTGEVVNGKVINVKEDQIILNVGFKSDGIITRSEYSNDNSLDLRTVVNVGDEMEAKVLKINDGEGQVLLSYKRLAQDRGNKKLEDAFNNKEVLTGKVVQVVDGGLSVVVDDARVFIPASLVSDTFERDLSKYKDADIEFIITEFNPRRRRIIGDRKQLLLAKKEEQKKKDTKKNIADAKTAKTQEANAKKETEAKKEVVKESKIGVDRKLISGIPGTNNYKGKLPAHSVKEKGSITISYVVDANGRVISAQRVGGLRSRNAINNAITMVKKHVKAEKSKTQSTGTYTIEFK